MLGIVLEDILLVSIVKHDGESEILSSSIFPILFIQIGLQFSLIGKTYLLKCVFLKAWNFLSHAKEDKSWEIKRNNRSSVAICWAVPTLVL